MFRVLHYWSSNATWASAATGFSVERMKYAAFSLAVLFLTGCVSGPHSGADCDEGATTRAHFGIFGLADAVHCYATASDPVPPKTEEPKRAEDEWCNSGLEDCPGEVEKNQLAMEEYVPTTTPEEPAVAVAAATSSVTISRPEPSKEITVPEPNAAMRAALGLEEGQLTEAEVRQYLAGNTLSGRTKEFVDFHIYFGRDGKLSGKAKATRYDTGRWQVLHNGWYCRQWNRWQDGTRECFKVFPAGENRLQFWKVDSESKSTHTIHHGDPENLKSRI
jgi:hypothetical protein